jgi:NAD-dependent dihydropyrimidine dehydrogenase PreA subunit
VLVGEVGGTQEERAASYARDHMSKPVVAYVAGRCAVSGVPMGHAGALVRGGTGTAAEKTAALESAGVGVAPRPGDVVGLVQAALARQQPDRAAARTEDAPAKRHKVALSVHINADLCKGTEGCGLCLAVCEEEVLAAAPKMNSRGVHAVTVADPGPCTGCGLCVLHCPDLAMWLRPRGEIPEAIAR